MSKVEVSPQKAYGVSFLSQSIPSSTQYSNEIPLTPKTLTPKTLQDTTIPRRRLQAKSPRRHFHRTMSVPQNLGVLQKDPLTQQSPQRLVHQKWSIESRNCEPSWSDFGDFGAMGDVLPQSPNANNTIHIRNKLEQSGAASRARIKSPRRTVMKDRSSRRLLKATSVRDIIGSDVVVDCKRNVGSHLHKSTSFRHI